jgi:hypothetical protein
LDVHLVSLPCTYIELHKDNESILNKFQFDGTVIILTTCMYVKIMELLKITSLQLSNSQDAKILMTYKETYFGDIRFSKGLHLTLKENTSQYD